MTAIHAPVFNLCAGHPVLDLVNTLDNRFRPEALTELLPDYGALLAFMQQSGLLEHTACQALAKHTDPVDAQQVTAAVRELREAAANVLYAVAEGSPPPAADIRTLESQSQMAHRHQKLQWVAADGQSGGPAGTSSVGGARSMPPKFVWGWRATQAEPERPLWILAVQTSSLLTSDALQRLHTCRSETCRWLFLDTSKNHTRRWCDMKICGNRMKARRFQARRM